MYYLLNLVFAHDVFSVFFFGKDWTATVVEKWLESIGYKEEAPLFAGKIKFERSSIPWLFNFC